MSDPRSSTALDCSNCDVTLVVRLDVSYGRMYEIANEQGWQCSKYNNDIKVLCSWCVSNLPEGKVNGP